jgi:hypothetical protein
MRSVLTSKFSKLYDNLPPNAKAEADKAFKLWMANPSHPGLNFEKVDDEDNVWSARLDLGYRAICKKRKKSGETWYIWFWIGKHDEYLRLINK